MATPYFPLPRPLVARRFGTGAGGSSVSAGGTAAALTLAFALGLGVALFIAFAFGKGIDLARDSNAREDWALSPRKLKQNNFITENNSPKKGGLQTIVFIQDLVIGLIYKVNTL